jgi:hypothetical protein
MQPHKSFITKLGELIDQHRAEQPSSTAAPSRPGRVQRFIRWLMPNGGTLLLIALLIATQGVWARNLQSPAAPGPSATTVNYQGRLADSGGTPINGSRGMEFAIYDAATGGNRMWGPETHAAIPVSNGLFSVGLGSQTSGGIPATAWNGDRYLEIQVGGETLSPRELIRSVPIAGMALTVPDGTIGTGQIADGAVTSKKMALQSGGVCLETSQTVQTSSSQYVAIPTMSTSIVLDKPSQVLIWSSGVFNHNVNISHVYTGVFSDNNIVFMAAQVVNTTGWFDYSMTRQVTLPAGTHTLSLRVQTQAAGTVVFAGSWGTGTIPNCLQYLVLGD